jgi:hypothetical protein
MSSTPPKRPQVFLEGGLFSTEQGNVVDIAANIASELMMDQQAWMDPDRARDIGMAILGRASPLTLERARVAQKVIAMPYYQREYEGESVTGETLSHVSRVKLMNAYILDRYVSLMSAEGVNQRTLRRAITGAVGFQLAARQVFGESTDDTVLLPTSPSEHYMQSAGDYTVLRRRSMGRASLLVGAQFHNGSDRIIILPGHLSAQGSSIEQLAASLATEQMSPSELTDDDVTRIRHASDTFMGIIDQHNFDPAQSS